MKINRLKFKQISNVIHKQQLNLDLFSQTNRLFQESNLTTFTKSTKTLNKFDQDKKNRSKTLQKTINRSYIKQSKPNPYKNKDIFYYLQESILNYLQYLSSQQRKSIKKEMEILLSILKIQNPKTILSKFNYLQISLSKKITNRLVHLMFYLIYNKINNDHQHIQKEIKKYILCEYYSRKFNFKDLALAICSQIQGLYCLINNYENGRVYARKCLKLAVILNNEYYQNKMIQAFYMLNYYQGRLNENKMKLLSKEERFRIIQNYRQENQIPDIFGLEDHDPSQDQYKEFALEHSNNFVQNNIPNQNIKYFQGNYHELIKIIPNKTMNLRKIMKKVSSVGLVKKYFGKDNFITIKPECHVIKPLNQGQVLITHKKQIGSKQKVKNIGIFTDRIIRLLTYLISSFSHII